MRSALLVSALFAVACTGATVQPATQDSEAAIWSYATRGANLRAQSCPDDAPFASAPDLTLRVIDAERGTEQARTKNLDGLTLAGAWQLESDNSGFGGVSGLDVLSAELLLAVTDDGKFIWIGMDAQTGAPDGTGNIAYMRDQDGKIFPNKRSADAEDLSVRDGLAFVSFEQTHRIMAYDLATCGSAARAAMVTNLNKVVDRRVLEDNRGAEALAFADDGLSVGFETRRRTGSPIGTVRTDGTLAELDRLTQPNLYLLTGMDSVGDLSATVFRAYDPLRGARVLLRVARDDIEIASAALRPPLPVDNFESVAIGRNPAGKTRIWLISDDNFSNDQRTLLLALDLTE
ncbi:MAG: esterase-like activity of phytase family protein [Pseudomonadota bacterium]